MERWPKWMVYSMIAAVTLLWAACTVANILNPEYRIPQIFDLLIPALLSALIGNEIIFRRGKKDNGNGKDQPQ